MGTVMSAKSKGRKVLAISPGGGAAVMASLTAASSCKLKTDAMKAGIATLSSVGCSFGRTCRVINVRWCRHRFQSVDDMRTREDMWIEALGRSQNSNSSPPPCVAVMMSLDGSMSASDDGELVCRCLRSWARALATVALGAVFLRAGVADAGG